MPGPTAKLAGRYRFVQSIQSGAKSVTWLAEDESTKRRVVASAIGAARLAAMTSVVGLEHAHLARILDCIVDPNPLEIPSERGPVKAAAVAVAEYVAGTTLHDELKRGKLSPRRAVDVILRVARAVVSLHENGGAHGAISPRSIVLAPRPHRTSPVLTQLVAPTSGAYSSPERLQGAPPSSTDDSWALHATLYAALTGSAPFSGSSKEELIQSMLAQPRAIEELGVAEPRLQLILEVGFSRHPGRRPAVAELIQALEARSGARVQSKAPTPEDDLERTSIIPLIDLNALVDEEASIFKREQSTTEPDLGGFAPVPPVPFSRSVAPLTPPREHERVTRDSDPTLTDERRVPSELADEVLLSEAPPPLSTAPEPAKSPVIVPKAAAHKSSAWVVWVPLAAALVTALGVAAYVLYDRSARRAEAPQPPSIAKTATLTPPPAPAQPASSEPGALAPPKAVTVAECTAAHFSPDTFPTLTGDAGDDFSFLCEEDDLRSLASKLGAKIWNGGEGASGNGGPVTDAMKRWSGLGWYEIAATAVVRRACCPAAASVNLPPNQGPCKQLAEVVEDVAKRPIREVDARTRAATYGEAVFCLYYYGVKRPYRYRGYPQKRQEESFAELLRRAARVPDDHLTH